MSKTIVGYGGEGEGDFEKHVNPQDTVNPLPFRRRAIYATRGNLLGGDLVQVEGQFVDRTAIILTATTLLLLGNPQDIKRGDLPDHFKPPSQVELIKLVMEPEHSEEFQMGLDTLAFGLSVIHQLARFQSAWYGGKPPDIDPTLIPVFLAECYEDMRDDQTLGVYIESQLDRIMDGNELYEPDEMSQLRTLLPDERKPLRRGVTKPFTKEQMKALRDQRAEWTDQMEDDGSDQLHLGILIEAMRSYANDVVDYQLADKDETVKDDTKLTNYHLINLGFYFGYWMYLHHKEVREISETFSLE